MCLAPGGASAAFYRGLAQHIGPGIEVVAAQYPGRQDRLGDPLITDLPELAGEIAADLLNLPPTPRALFGHSMGATVAYEVARRLAADGRPVRELIVSGRPAPDFVETGLLHKASDAELIDHLERLAADPAPVRLLRTEPGLAELVLPGLRADYQAVETYRHRPGSVLNCPVTAFVSTEDPTTSLAQAEQWQTVTDGPFSLCTFPGGHFYFDDEPRVVAEAITRCLT
ncbi:surfactin synthase thioesterase subunit [Nocardia caishijiensis]|uniref:Thioesterase TesA n=1 Tax=Nocardia caishijiensis TaxID=184756 RepID=A0ABQ6YLT2_9NOCA|nr:surfactin synthase thioesterase subunit [Nocardia caishijiensis]